MPAMPEAGQKAPAFDLPAWPDGRVRLGQFRGRQNVVLYFYPRDNTPGCTREACGFRDLSGEFDAADTVVLGVSSDSLVAHEKFAAKFSLPFRLLSDADHAVAAKYGVWVEKTSYGKKSLGMQRATFLIDKSGRIARVWPKVKVDGHVEEVLAAVHELEGRNPEHAAGPRRASPPDADERHVPFLELLGVRPLESRRGRAEFEMTVESRHLRTLGLLHGGVIASLLDTAMGFAAVTVSPDAHHPVTIQLNVNFVRPVREGERLRATGDVRHHGRQTAVTSGEIHTSDGKLAACGTATFMFVPIAPASK